MIRVCAVQMVSTFDMQANLATAENLIESAKSQKADWVVLPENFAVLDSDNLFGWGEEERKAQCFSGFLQSMSQKYGIGIVGGTIPMRTRPDGTLVEGTRVRAACLVFNHEGSLVTRYDKIHLFDVIVGDSQGVYHESSVIEPGNEVVAADLSFGRLGLSVCYDLRFPELYGQLSELGCHLLTVPSAFTYKTGAAHWEILLRARAIENQVYVIAPNQGGQHANKRRTWGQSMIIDPWGVVLSEVKEEGAGLALADLDFAWLDEIRSAMPVRQHRRFRVSLNK